MKLAKALVAIALVTLLACGASFTGSATAVAPGSCEGHLACGSYCCTAAGADGEGWECGGTWPDCPPNACCYTGDDVGPGDTNAGAMGVHNHLHCLTDGAPRPTWCDASRRGAAKPGRVKRVVPLTKPRSAP